VQTRGRAVAVLIASLFVGIVAALLLARNVSAWRLILYPHGRAGPSVSGGGGYRSPLAAFSPDAERLVTVASDDGPPEVWDVASGRLIRSLAMGTDTRAWCVTWSPDARNVAAGVDGGVRVWDIDGPGRTVSDEGMRAAVPVFSPDGRWLAAVSPNNDEVRFIDVDSRRTVQRHRLPCLGLVRDMAWSPDSRSFALCDMHHLWVWDVPSGRAAISFGRLILQVPWPHIATDDDERRLLYREATAASRPATQPAPVQVASPWSLSFAPDAAALLVAYRYEPGLYDNVMEGAQRLRCYDPATGAVLWDQPLVGQPRCVRFSPDGSRYAVLQADGHPNVITVFDAATQAERWTANPEQYLDERTPTGWADSIEWSPDGTRLLLDSAPPVIIDAERGVPVAVIGRRPESFHTVAYSRDGRRLLTVPRTFEAGPFPLVWEQRRRAQAHAVLRRPETWVLLVACVAFALGLQQLSRSRRPRAETVRRLRIPAVAFVGAVAAWHLADFVVELVTGVYWWTRWKGSNEDFGAVIAGDAVLLTCLLGGAFLAAGRGRAPRIVGTILVLALNAVTLFPASADLLDLARARPIDMSTPMRIEVMGAVVRPPAWGVLLMLSVLLGLSVLVAVASGFPPRNRSGRRRSGDSPAARPMCCADVE